MGYVGERVWGVKEQRLVRGAGTYVADLPLPDGLHAGFLRSPYAHARIISVDTAPASSFKDVAAVYTVGGLPELASPAPPPEQPPDIKAHGIQPLGSGTVRYVGEPVAVVLAASRTAVADALDAIEVDYEPLEAVGTLDAALEARVNVWDDVPDNICTRSHWGYGDVESAFRDADVVVELEVDFARSAAGSLETRAVAAVPGGEAGVRVTLWDSTQAPHNVARSLARYFGWEEDEVRVVAPDVGGGFGPKGRTYAEEYVLAALALRHDRPIRWMATRTEDLQTTCHGRAQRHRARLAARSDGAILALDDRFMQDAGAYVPSGLGIPQNTVRHLIGPYRLAALSAEVLGVYTNRVPSTALRGGGRPEGVYVMERLLDRLADRLALDRVEIRRRNVIRAHEYPYDTGLETAGRRVVYDSGRHLEYLECAERSIDRKAFQREQTAAREQGRYLGLGFSTFIESTGAGSESSRVELLADGTVAVGVGSPSTGQSHDTIFAQIAADRLGIDIEAVQVISGDSSLVPGTGTFASRMAVDGGNAVALAAGDAREQILARAADLLEASPDDLQIDHGRISVRGYTERGIELRDVAREAARHGQPIVATRSFEAEHGSVWAGGANAAVVEVDVETGLVSILRYVVAHDSGVLVNPAVVEGQVQGAVAHGIGNVLLESCEYGEDGQLLTSTFADYLMPSFGSVPRVEMVHFETPSPFNPEGIKGAGESGTIGALPTLASAIEDALAPFGVQIDSLPVPAEELLERIRAGK